MLSGCLVLVGGMFVIGQVGYSLLVAGRLVAGLCATNTKVGLLVIWFRPFKEIKEIHWPLGEGGKAKLLFEGDIFEMEDHRNWTDASYKTYCTPLELPFPAEIHEGKKIYQKVLLNIHLSSLLSSKSQIEEIKIDFSRVLQKPGMGSMMPRFFSFPAKKETELLHH